MKLKSQFIFSSDEDGDTIAMCISRDVLNKLLLKYYPNVGKHWKRIAKVRRREFTRLIFIAKKILSNPNSPGFSTCKKTIMKGEYKKSIYPLKNFQDEVMAMDFDDEDLDKIPDDERERNKNKEKREENQVKVQNGIKNI